MVPAIIHDIASSIRSPEYANDFAKQAGAEVGFSATELLGDGGDSASHESKEARLKGLTGGDFLNEDFVGFGADLFEQECPFCHERRREGDYDRCGDHQSLDLPQTGIQQSTNLTIRDMVVIKGVEEVQNDKRIWQSLGGCQQRVEFIAGEGAPAEQAVCYCHNVHCLSAQEVGNQVGLITIPAVEDRERSAQGKFGNESHAFPGARGVEGNQSAFFKEREGYPSRKGSSVP